MSLVKYNGQLVEKYPYTVDELYADNPGIYFPDLSANTLSRFNVGVVVVTGAPIYDVNTEVAEQSGCEYSVERDRWEMTWSIRSMTAEELAARVPQSVSMRQGRLALLELGKLDSVDEAIGGMPDPIKRKAAQIEWEYAATIQRDSSLVSQLGASLGLTEIELDQLFSLASTL